MTVWLTEREREEQRAKILQRREMVRNFLLSGYTNNVVIARALKVSEGTVRSDRRAIQQEHMQSGLHTLSERIDFSVMRREELFRQCMEILNSNGRHRGREVYTKDLIAMIDVSNKVLNDLDALQGTTAPDKVNSAVVAEVYGAFVSMLTDIDPSLATRLQQRIQERLAGTAAGNLLPSASSLDAFNDALNSQGSLDDDSAFFGEGEVVDEDVPPTRRDESDESFDEMQPLDIDDVPFEEPPEASLADDTVTQVPMMSSGAGSGDEADPEMSELDEWADLLGQPEDGDDEPMQAIPPAPAPPVVRVPGYRMYRDDYNGDSE